MLKGQKFNGVSLFATLEPDNNPLKIITSDDGLGEKIELARTGLFENLNPSLVQMVFLTLVHMVNTVN